VNARPTFSPPGGFYFAWIGIVICTALIVSIPRATDFFTNFFPPAFNRPAALAVLIHNLFWLLTCPWWVPVFPRRAGKIAQAKTLFSLLALALAGAVFTLLIALRIEPFPRLFLWQALGIFCVQLWGSWQIFRTFPRAYYLLNIILGLLLPLIGWLLEQFAVMFNAAPPPGGIDWLTWGSGTQALVHAAAGNDAYQQFIILMLGGGIFCALVKFRRAGKNS